jgi:hypothetical protein
MDDLNLTEGKGKELAAAGQQLSIALGLDHEELLQRAALQRMFNAEPGLARKASRQVQENAWRQRLGLILPELASRVELLYPCSSNQFQGDLWPCSLCVGTDHYWDSEEEFSKAEAECQVIAEKLAELLAAVPGPIETVDVIPGSHDSNLAEVAVKRSSGQLEAGQ